MTYSIRVSGSLAPGDVCGGHRVVRLLGKGGFAQVYEVVGPDGARRALKILDAEAEARPKVRARLAQEGAALTVLDHANVVRLYDAGVDGERIYLVLELVDGKNLRQALQARPAVETIVRWLRQAADGVGEAHRRGIVHRDLKPENLLVTPQDIVKVIDFGIAKLAGWGVKTTQEQKLGTALYMSPEQIQGKPPDARMDVYALGLILYEALAGAHPVVPTPTSVYQICALQLGHRPRSLLEVVPALPPELAAVADRAIEKDPSRRLPDMRAFVEGLHAGLLRLGEPRFGALRAIVSREAQAAAATTAPVFSSPSLGVTAALPSQNEIQTGPMSAPSAAGAPRRIPPTQPMRAVDALPFAATAVLPSGEIPAALQTPSARAMTPSYPMFPSTPPAASPKPQNKGVVVVVLAVVAMAVAAGLVALRLFAWPF
jgi:serine/threonine protein kinase